MELSNEDASCIHSGFKHGPVDMELSNEDASCKHSGIKHGPVTWN